MNSDTAKAVVIMGSKILRLVLHFCTTKSFVDLVGIVLTYFKYNKNSESEATDFDDIFYTTGFRKPLQTFSVWRVSLSVLVLFILPFVIF